MKEIFEKIIEIVADADFGVLYPSLVPLIVSAVFFITYVIGWFLHKIKRLDKTPFLGVSLAAYSITLVKVTSDLLYNRVTEDFILSCFGGLFFVAASFGLYALLVVQYNSKIKLNRKEKRLIDRLSSFSDAPEDSGIIKNAFNLSDKKSVEFLPVFKRDYGEGNGKDYSLNYGEVLSYIENARRYELTGDENALLDNLENDIEKYSTSGISCEERLEFSEKLMKLVKIISKYSPDKFANVEKNL